MADCTFNFVNIDTFIQQTNNETGNVNVLFLIKTMSTSLFILINSLFSVAIIPNNYNLIHDLNK